MRTAILDKSVNPHASQYDEQNEEWNRCMQRELGSYVSFDTDDPRVKQAMEKCKDLAPPADEYMHSSGVLGKLAALLTTPCFHVSVKGAEQSSFPDKMPEYFFMSSFDAGISGETDSQGREIRSRFNLELYYNGNPVELVKRWTTESTVTTVSSQYNRMFDNSDALLRGDLPFDNLLHNFERRPVNCNIDCGDKEEMGPGEEAEIKIQDFKDEKGKTPKYFNRIIVKTEHGRIKGGSRLHSDPLSDKCRAFPLDRIPVTFVYEAPDDGSSQTDKITVYSSCQIHNPEKVAMEFTETDKKIAEKEIKIIRPDLTADYLSTLEENLTEGEFNYLLTFKSNIRASYRLINVSADKDDGIIKETYRQISSSLKDFSGDGNIHWDRESPHCLTTGKGSTKATGCNIHQTTGLLRITYDAGSGDVRKVEIDHFNLEYLMDGQLVTTTKCDNPPEVKTSSSPWPLTHVPKTIHSMVDDDPEFQKASGNRNSGIITGGGTKTYFVWRINVNYTLSRDIKK
ncbi:MAG: hypothetical protein JXN62_08285 [Bacteroidales bacterium]|nr:hypothetical protein [Bacteroidales bacterium]